jgi:photosystem II biogenesis protein Psp29
VDKTRTVSDTKREFYNHHTRPINSVYRRVVEELMVEMHLLSVNGDFKSNPIYSLGIVSSFDRFMQGYQPEKDRESIFIALCKSSGGDPQKYRQEAESMKALAKRMSFEPLVSWLSNPTPTDEVGLDLAQAIGAIANNPHFKYSRLFAIGVYTAIEEADAELLKEPEKRSNAIDKIAQALHLPADKMQKDLDLHRSNLDKMDQLLAALQDILKADRKQREQRISDKT